MPVSSVEPPATTGKHLLQFWMVAGANGSGKTTATRYPSFRELLSNISILNPDSVTQGILRAQPELEITKANRDAADIVEELVARAIRSGESIGVETVLSTEKYATHIAAAKQAGYIVSMIYIAVASPDIAVQRVAARVRLGGHDVPEDKIRTRWVRSHRIFAQLLPELDAAFVLDNTTDRPVLVARKVRGQVELLTPGRLPMIDEVLKSQIT